MQDIRQIIEEAIDKHAQAENLKYQEIKDEIKETKEAVNTLLETWNQTKGVLSFIKWFVGACASLGVIFAFLRDHLK